MEVLVSNTHLHSPLQRMTFKGQLLLINNYLLTMQLVLTSELKSLFWGEE